MILNEIKKYLEQDRYKELPDKNLLTEYDDTYRNIYEKYHTDFEPVYELYLNRHYSLRFLNEAIIILIDKISYPDIMIIPKEDMEQDNSYLVLKYGKVLTNGIGHF